MFFHTTAREGGLSINGALLVAGLVGLLTGSFTAFLVAALALILGAVYRGDIR
ncbi:MAG: hypothetical protein N2C14_01220 [Planctomycetales bacterium]